MPSFQFVEPSDEQKLVLQHYRSAYEGLSQELDKLEPSRGLSLAKTKLEESAFWVNKSITKND